MSFKEAINYAKTLDINLIPYENYKDMSETKEVIANVKRECRSEYLSDLKVASMKQK